MRSTYSRRMARISAKVRRELAEKRKEAETKKPNPSPTNETPHS